MIILYNPLPNNKLLDWSKLKVFADDKLNGKLKFVLETAENILGKRENAVDAVVTSIFSFSNNIS